MAETGGVFRIENGKPAEIKFTATFARFIRMVISKTLNQDSGILKLGLFLRDLKIIVLRIWKTIFNATNCAS